MPEVEAARRALDGFARTYGARFPPVDVEGLAGSLYRLRVRLAADLGDVAEAPAGVPLSGLLVPRAYEIWVRRDESESRRRFSVAHEVGHWVLHVPAAAQAVFCRRGDVLPDVDEAALRRERAANRFAAELLMPEGSVRAEAERVGPDPNALAERFAVSPIAMAFRLVNLSYLEALPPALERDWQRWRQSL